MTFMKNSLLFFCNNPLFSSLVSSDKSIWNSTLGCRVWVFGPEVEIIAAASLLNATIYVYIYSMW